MDEIQKILTEAGRKDLAQKYYRKISKRKEVETHKLEIKLVDFTKDKHEPAYDIEIYIDGKSVSGGTSKGIISLDKYDGDKNRALTVAKKRIQEIFKKLERIAKE